MHSTANDGLSAAPIVGRFAPSPTGEMHLGNVLAALLSWLSAKKQGGLWRLRIEDLDPQRSRQEYADRLMRDLEWLGLPWDGEVVYQSRRTEVYARYLDRLSPYIYPCTCTRNEILAAQAPHESDGRIVYPGTCRPAGMRYAHLLHGLSAHILTSARAAMRIIVPDEDIIYTDGHYGKQQVNLATHCGDFILRRSDGVFAYQLAVVVDDAEMGVTEIVRGRDLLLSAAQQIYLHRLIQPFATSGLPFHVPAYCHHPLLINAAGQRLSKRDQALALSQLRSVYTPEQLIGSLAHLAGIIPRPDCCTPEELIEVFDWTNVPVQDVIVQRILPE